MHIYPGDETELGERVSVAGQHLLHLGLFRSLPPAGGRGSGKGVANNSHQSDNCTFCTWTRLSPTFLGVPPPSPIRVSCSHTELFHSLLLSCSARGLLPDCAPSSYDRRIKARLLQLPNMEMISSSLLCPTRCEIGSHSTSTSACSAHPRTGLSSSIHLQLSKAAAAASLPTTTTAGDSSMAFVASSNCLRACRTTEGRPKGEAPVQTTQAVAATAEREVDDAGSASDATTQAVAATAGAATAEREVDDAASASDERWEMGKTAYVNYPVDKVWELMEDFVAIYRWHPSVVSSVLSSGEPQKPGVVRYVVTVTGDTFYEMLTKLDTEGPEVRYTALENTFGLVDYHAQIRLRTGVHPHTTVMTWTSNMSPSPIKTRDQIYRILGEGFLRCGQKITQVLSLAAAAAEAKHESVAGGAAAKAPADASVDSLQLPSTISN